MSVARVPTCWANLRTSVTHALAPGRVDLAQLYLGADTAFACVCFGHRQEQHAVSVRAVRQGTVDGLRQTCFTGVGTDLPLVE